MAEEKLELRGINWQETFSFTHVFRSFRLAIHPSKLVLAFAALALCLIGGLVLDGLWYGGSPIIWQDGAPLELEVFAEKGTAQVDFTSWHESKLQGRERSLKRLRDGLNLTADDLNVKSHGVAGRLIAEKKVRLADHLKTHSLEEERKRIRERYRDQEERRIELIKEADERVPKENLAYRRQAQAEMEAIRDLAGTGPARRGPFRSLLRYEMVVFNGLVTSAVNLNLLGGLDVTQGQPNQGVVLQVCRGLKGLGWMLRQHCVYFVIFGVFCLVVWSIFGGAISRIAALHVARGEKISLKEALKFGVKKFPSFLFAPLIPIAIVAFLGLLVLLGSLIVGNWGWGIA